MPRAKRSGEPLPPHVHRGHSGSVQQQQAGLNSARRQSLDQAWADAMQNAERSLALIRGRVRWE